MSQKTSSYQLMRQNLINNNINRESLQLKEELKSKKNEEDEVLMS